LRDEKTELQQSIENLNNQLDSLNQRLHGEETNLRLSREESTAKSAQIDKLNVSP